MELLKDIAILLAYFIPCALAALLLRRWVRIPKEVFRKILHLILLGSFPILLYAIRDWRLACGASLCFAALLYPALWALERFPAYARILIERRHGEIRKSLLIVFFMFALVIALAVGVMGNRTLALASVMSWGLGDAAAALVGKRFGRHPAPIRRQKSLEGSAAMMAVAFSCVAVLFFLQGTLPAGGILAAALICAPATAFVELVTPGGYDTITCPLTAIAVLAPFVWFLGGGL